MRTLVVIVSFLFAQASFGQTPVPEPAPIDDREFEEEDIMVDPITLEAEFPGGQAALFEFIGSHIKYPQVAIDSGFQGKVYVGFIIDTSGKVSEATVVKGIHESLDKEALRVINMMPRWKPAEQAGTKIKTKYHLPIKFKLG